MMRISLLTQISSCAGAQNSRREFGSLTNYFNTLLVLYLADKGACFRILGAIDRYFVELSSKNNSKCDLAILLE